MKRIIYAIMLLMAIVSCNKEDDIDDIFVGRNWKLSYIQEGNIRRNSNKDYSILFQENIFEATLPGGKNIKGNWRANGETRSFNCANVKASGSLRGDTIAEKMLQILTKAQNYAGDENYLQIKEQHNVYIQFHNR